MLARSLARSTHPTPRPAPRLHHARAVRRAGGTSVRLFLETQGTCGPTGVMPKLKGCPLGELVAGEYFCHAQASASVGCTAENRMPWNGNTLQHAPSPMAGIAAGQPSRGLARRHSELRARAHQAVCSADTSARRPAQPPLLLQRRRRKLQFCNRALRFPVRRLRHPPISPPSQLLNTPSLPVVPAPGFLQRCRPRCLPTR